MFPVRSPWQEQTGLEREREPDLLGWEGRRVASSQSGRNGAGPARRGRGQLWRREASGPLPSTGCGSARWAGKRAAPERTVPAH